MKRTLITVLASIFLIACSEAEENKEKTLALNNYIEFNEEISPSQIMVDDNKIKFNRGVYTLCLNNLAYVVGAQDASIITPVKDKNEQLACVEKYKDKTVSIFHTKVKRGMFNMCIGGYEFLVLSEGSRSLHVVQKFSSGDAAKLCIPENKDLNHLNKLVFLHPLIFDKIKGLNSFLNDVDAMTENKKSIY